MAIIIAKSTTTKGEKTSTYKGTKTNLASAYLFATLNIMKKFHIVSLSCFPQSLACWSYSNVCNALITTLRPKVTKATWIPLIHGVPWGSYYNCHTRKPLSFPRVSLPRAAPEQLCFHQSHQATNYFCHPNLPEIKHQQKNTPLLYKKSKINIFSRPSNLEE